MSITICQKVKVKTQKIMKTKKKKLKMMIGIKKGSELVFKNANIKCKVKNDSEVVYNDKTYALSTLENELLKEVEYKDLKERGLHCFRYKGKRLID